MFDASFHHPEALPGEPVRAWGAPATFRLLLQKTAELLLAAALGLPFWPLYLLLRLFWRRPPIVCSLARSLRCARMILTERPAQGPTVAMQLSLFLELGRRVALNGARGVAWFLDEIIWGRDLQRVRIVAPLFEISAARSGSTQLSRYLEDDPHLCAPSVLQESFPLVWLWRLAPRVERFMPKGWLDKMAHTLMPKELQERHEVNLLRTDTFEIVFLAFFQLGDIFISLGPRAWAEEFHYAFVQEASREVWEDDFLRFIDAIGRKALMVARPDPEGLPRRLLLKGHFLLVAPALAQRYPDARFLTMLRAPEKRMQSLINFLRCQTTLPPCPAAPWPWLVEYACTAEVAYCDTEMAWFQRAEGPRRCVVRFDQYLRDLEGTMREVYRQCLDRDLSEHVPRAHAERVRTNYSVDRSLAQLGVDEAALKRRLDAYGRWCRTAA